MENEQIHPHVILRKDLEELACLGRSHMPEKLEEKLSVAQLADLFAFIRQTGPRMKPPLSHQPEIVAAETQGSLRLLARKATISARRVTFDPQQQCLIWHAGDPDDHVSWLVDVPSAGTYDLLIQWTQIPGYADNPFVIQAGSSRVAGRFPSTGGWGRWQKKRFGQLQLAPGRHLVTLRPDGPVKGELSDLREIQLVPAEAQ